MTVDYFEDKQSRNECYRFDCSRAAQHFILWKCPDGHRTEILRCSGHIEEDTRRALSLQSTIPVCSRCPGIVVMDLVLENA